MKRRRKKTMLGQPTKQDFEAIAEILCEFKADGRLTSALGIHFQRRNPRFSFDRFYAASTGPKCRVRQGF